MNKLDTIVRLARRIVRLVRSVWVGRVRVHVTEEPIKRDGPAPRIVTMAIVAAPERRALPESMWEPASRAEYRDAPDGPEWDEAMDAAREIVCWNLREALYSDDGHKGATKTAFRSLTRNAYREHVEFAFMRAEDGCRGHLLSRAGKAANTDPRDLFQGPWHIARRHASEELLSWWANEYGEGEERLTYDEYVDDLLREALEEYGREFTEAA